MVCYYKLLITERIALAFANVTRGQYVVLGVECGGLVLRIAAHNLEIGSNTTALEYLAALISRRQGELREVKDSYDLVGDDRDVRP